MTSLLGKVLRVCIQFIYELYNTNDVNTTRTGDLIYLIYKFRCYDEETWYELYH